MNPACDVAIPADDLIQVLQCGIAIKLKRRQIRRRRQLLLLLNWRRYWLIGFLCPCRDFNQEASSHDERQQLERNLTKGRVEGAFVWHHGLKLGVRSFDAVFHI